MREEIICLHAYALYFCTFLLILSFLLLQAMQILYRVDTSPVLGLLEL